MTQEADNKAHDIMVQEFKYYLGQKARQGCIPNLLAKLLLILTIAIGVYWLLKLAGIL